MKFEDALKRLTEEESEKFEWMDVWLDLSERRLVSFSTNIKITGPERFVCYDWYDKVRNGISSIEFHGINQDDIDEILALIGWGYEVSRMNINANEGFVFTCSKIEDFSGRAFVGMSFRGPTWVLYPRLADDIIFSDKLSAAKAALIAVIEHQYPNKEQP